MRQKYSGNTAKSAPAALALATSSSAISKLFSTELVETICMLAIFSWPLLFICQFYFLLGLCC